MQDDDEPILAIEASPATAEQLNREKVNTSQTFFVTLQDANKRESGEAGVPVDDIIQASLEQDESVTHTLVGS